MGTVINLKWKRIGPCPDQWFAYFYNESEDRTYEVYLREDTYWWSAALSSAKGQHTAEEFERIPSEQQVYENIPLAFYYDTDVDNRPKMEEEVLLFDSKIREQYDFTAGLEYMDDGSRTELLERRAELMRRYLAKYEEFKK